MFSYLVIAFLLIVLLRYIYKLREVDSLAKVLLAMGASVIFVAIATRPVKTSNQQPSPAMTTESVHMTPGQIVSTLQRGEEVPLTELLLHCGGFGQMSFAKEAAHETGLSPQEVAAILQNNDPTSTCTLYVHLGAKKGQAEQVPSAEHYQPNSWKCIAP